MRFPVRIATIAALLVPASVFALEDRSIIMTTGIRISFAQAVQNLVSFLAISIVGITTVLFLIGAALMVSSGGAPGRLEMGQKLMKGSLMGMAIVLGSYTILRTVFFLIY